jgi:hypothetical protein
MDVSNAESVEKPVFLPRSSLRRGAKVLLVACICGSALALAGAHFRVVQVVSIAVLVSAVLALLADTLTHVPSPAWIFAGLSAYSLVQTLAFPLRALTILSPHSADRWARALQPLGEQVTAGSLSLDPGATSLESAKWASYAVVFSLASAFGRRRGAAPIIALVCVSAVAVAVLTIAHALVGATAVYGFYEVKYAKAGWRIGPMLNSNSLAGYCMLGACCALGLFASENTVRGKSLYGTSIVLLSTMVAVSGSRGGFVALVLALLLFGFRYWKAAPIRGRRRLPLATWGVLGLGLATAATFSLMLIPDAWDQLTQRNTDKVRVWSWAVPLIKDFSLFGVGRGAFETAFASYKPGGDDLVYTHPENIVVQWVSEWGIPVAAASFGALLWQLRPSEFRTNRHVAALGALLGVGALVLQNFIDLGLELFAPMLAVSALLGACFGQTSHRHSSSSRRAGRKGAWLLCALSFVTAATALARGNSVSLERLDAHASLQHVHPANRAQVEATKASLRGAMLRHPAEAYFPRLGAMLALRIGENPFPWLSHALDLSPTESRTHWVLANALHVQGAIGQAMLEARLAAEYDPAIAPTIGTAVVRWSKLVQDIERAAPPGTPGAIVLHYAAVNAGADASVLFKARLLRAAVRRDPNLVMARSALAPMLMLLLRASRSDQQARLELEREVLDQAAALERLQPERADGSELRASLYTELGRPLDADRELSARCPVLDEQEQVRCWSALLSAAPRDPKNREMLDRVSDRLVKTACAFGVACAAALTQAGVAMGQVGDLLGALDYFQRAASKEPSVPAFLRVADCEAALGRKPLAERALNLAVKRAGANATELRAIDAKRRELFGSAQRAERPNGPPAEF